MRAAIALCLLAAVAASDDGLDGLDGPDGLEGSVDSYLNSARFGKHEGVVSVQLNLWTAVARGTVNAGGGPVDLQGDLDVGILDESWQSLAAPLVGAGIGAIVGLFGTAQSGSSRQLDAMGAGAAAGALATPFILDRAIDLTAQYNFSVFGVRFDGFYYSADGEATLVRPISFGGATFAAGDNVDSEFRVAQARLSFLWTFLRPPEERYAVPRDPRGGDFKTALSLFVGGAWVRYDASIVSTTAVGSASESVVLPQVGLLLEARIEGWAFEVVVAGGGDGTSLWVDGRASAAYVIADLVAIRFGYRYILADLESNGFAWDGSLDGFYFGVGLHF